MQTTQLNNIMPLGLRTRYTSVFVVLTAALFVFAYLPMTPDIAGLAPLKQREQSTIWATPLMLLLGLACYGRVLQKTPHLFFISAAGLWLMFVYIFNHPILDNQYDWLQNISAIQYYANSIKLPVHNELLEAHQAPLYYEIAGGIYKLGSIIWDSNSTDLWLLLQAFSFGMFALFLLYGVMIIQRTIRSPFLVTMGVCALMFWPANLLHCGRISNNILIYLTFTGCAYHLLAWFEGGDLKQLNRALLWMGIAFGTQTSAAILLASFITLSLYQHGNRYPMRQWPRIFMTLATTSRPDAMLMKPLLSGMIVLCVGIILGYGRNFYNYLQNDQVSVIFGTYAGATSFVPSLYFTFSLKQYLTHPYIVINSAQHLINMQFWGYLLRSMSFGQHTWNGSYQAVVLNILLLCQWLFLGISMYYWRIRKKHMPEGCGYSAVFLFYSVAALACAKALIPELSYFWADVRYVYPVVVFFLVVYLGLLQQLEKKGYKTVYGLGLALLAEYNLFSFIHIYLQLAR